MVSLSDRMSMIEVAMCWRFCGTAATALWPCIRDPIRICHVSGARIYPETRSRALPTQSWTGSPEGCVVQAQAFFFVPSLQNWSDAGKRGRESGTAAVVNGTCSKHFDAGHTEERRARESLGKSQSAKDDGGGRVAPRRALRTVTFA